MTRTKEAAGNKSTTATRADTRPEWFQQTHKRIQQEQENWIQQKAEERTGQQAAKARKAG